MHKAHVCYAGSLACATRTGAHVEHCARVTVLRVRCSTVLACRCSARDTRCRTARLPFIGGRGRCVSCQAEYVSVHPFPEGTRSRRPAVWTTLTSRTQDPEQAALPWCSWDTSVALRTWCPMSARVPPRSAWKRHRAVLLPMAHSGFGLPLQVA